MDRIRFRGAHARNSSGTRGRYATALVAVAALAAPALALSATKVPRPVALTPTHGSAFKPALGDWEGSVDGFPVSFNLQWFTKTAKPEYRINGLVAFVPTTCPRVSYDYSEAVISSTNGGVPVGPRGGFNLGRFGFSGGLTGSRSASLTIGASKGCGPLTFSVHPARRLVVHDGTWKATFSDGETSRFSVLGEGRLAAGLGIPSGLTRCNGVTGAVDLFIGTAGGAYTFQPNVSVAMRFSHTSAKGTIDAGCASGGLSFTAKPVS